MKPVLANPKAMIMSTIAMDMDSWKRFANPRIPPKEVFYIKLSD